MDVLDLTGRWSGEFRYPARQAPGAFTATISQAGEWLTGTTEEVATEWEVRGCVITATLQGKRDGLQVQFLKLYDGDYAGYDAVAYEGQVSADGKEIAGTWRVLDDWSGSFVMTRQGELARAIERNTEEKV